MTIVEQEKMVNEKAQKNEQLQHEFDAAQSVIAQKEKELAETKEKLAEAIEKLHQCRDKLKENEKCQCLFQF